MEELPDVLNGVILFEVLLANHLEEFLGLIHFVECVEGLELTQGLFHVCLHVPEDEGWEVVQEDLLDHLLHGLLYEVCQRPDIDLILLSSVAGKQIHFEHEFVELVGLYLQVFFDALAAEPVCVFVPLDEVFAGLLDVVDGVEVLEEILLDFHY